MLSIRTLFNCFRTSKAAQPEENPNLAFVDRIVNGPFSVLRHRMSRLQKVSQVLLDAAVLAAVAWGAFSLMAHHYALDASISHLQMPQSVYGALDAVSPPQASSSGVGGIAEVESPLEGLTSSVGEAARLLGTVLTILMGIMGVYMVLVNGNFAGLIGAIVVGATLNGVLPAVLGGSDSTGHSRQVIERSGAVDELRTAVNDGNFSKIRTLIENASISSEDRMLVFAQLDLAARNTGTLAQKAAAGALRKAERLPVGDGQWAYAMEIAADGHVQTKAGAAYMLDTLETARAWHNASVFARSVVLAMTVACLVASALWIILRRRVARISDMLELLA